MRYIKVKWRHASDSEPVLLYSELDDNRFEVRKVEVYADGRCGYADGVSNSGDTRLGEVPVPPLDEIAADSDFEPTEIAREEFDEAWTLACG